MHGWQWLLCTQSRVVTISLRLTTIVLLLLLMSSLVSLWQSCNTLLPQSTAPSALIDNVAASLINLMHLFTWCISLIHSTLLGHLHTQLGHADYNCMLFSAALSLSFLPSEFLLYHRYVINSNVPLEIESLEKMFNTDKWFKKKVATRAGVQWPLW